MDQSNKTNKSQRKGRLLRVKIINLLYLIFIVITFLYIPADFIRIFKDFDNSLEQIKIGNAKLSTYNTKIMNLLTANPDETGNKLVEGYERAHESALRILSTIEEYKGRLVDEAGGYDKRGFVKNGRDYQGVEKLFIRRNLADSIRDLFINYKKLLKPIIDKKSYGTVDSLLNVDKIVNSKGKELAWRSFYFDKVPISVAIAILLKCQDDVGKSDNLVTEFIIRKLSHGAKTNVGFDIPENGVGIGGAHYVDDKIVLQLSDNDLLEKSEFESIISIVQHNNETDSLPVGNGSEIEFYPNESGEYQFSVVFDNQLVKKEIEVQDAKSVLQLMQPPVIYSRIDNLLMITHNSKNTKGVEVTISKGKVIRKSGNYYARVNSLGDVWVSVYRIGLNGGKKLLDKKKFVVRAMPDIYATLYGRTSGSISAKVLKLQKKVKLRNSDYSNFNLKVKNFEIARISSNGMVKKATNEGASFDVRTRSVINEARAGDIYVVRSINIGEPGGGVFKIPPILLKVK